MFAQTTAVFDTRKVLKMLELQKGTWVARKYLRSIRRLGAVGDLQGLTRFLLPTLLRKGRRPPSSNFSSWKTELSTAGCGMTRVTAKRDGMWEAGKKSFWRHQSGLLPLAPTQEMPDKIEHVQPPQDDIWPREPSQEGCPTGSAQSRLAI